MAENLQPTLGKQPTTPMAQKYTNNFKSAIKTAGATNLLKEVDSLLSEAEQSLKKKIFDLAKMEALVFSDPKLSAVYEEMSKNGAEKYGYHFNETIMNLLFNDYVLNSPMYLQKYKMAIPKEKKRRDQSGINQLKKVGKEKMQTRNLEPKPQKPANETTGAGGAAGGSAGAFSGSGQYSAPLGYDKKVDETTSAGSSGQYSGPAVWGSGDLMKTSGKAKVKTTPAFKGGTIIQETKANYLVDPFNFEKYVERLNEEDLSYQTKLGNDYKQSHTGSNNGLGVSEVPQSTERTKKKEGIDNNTSLYVGQDIDKMRDADVSILHNDMTQKHSYFPHKDNPNLKNDGIAGTIKEEEDVADEPNYDEDCFIQSDGNKLSVSCGGKFIGEFVEDDQAFNAVKSWKQKNNFFPNTWFVSDHGNVSLVDDEGNIIKEENKSQEDSTIIDKTSAFTSNAVKSWNNNDTNIEMNTLRTGEPDKPNLNTMEEMKNEGISPDMYSTKEDLKELTQRLKQRTGKGITKDHISMLAGEALYTVAIQLANRLLPVSWDDLADTNSMWDYIDQNGNMSFDRLMKAVKEACNDRLAEEGMSLNDLGENKTVNEAGTSDEALKEIIDMLEGAEIQSLDHEGIVYIKNGIAYSGNDQKPIKLSRKGWKNLFDEYFEQEGGEALYESKLNEKAKSASQQHLFGMAHAVQKGELPASKVGGAVKKIAKTVSPEDVEDFAKTKTKNLPEKVKPKKVNEDFGVNEYIVSVKHDNGVKTIKTTASNDDAAKKKVMAAEGCPESAITGVKQTKKLNENLIQGALIGNDVVDIKPQAGENPFELNGGKFQYEIATYVDGHTDNVVYSFTDDVYYDYRKFREAMELGLEESTDMNNPIDRESMINSIIEMDKIVTPLDPPTGMEGTHWKNLLNRLDDNSVNQIYNGIKKKYDDIKANPRTGNWNRTIANEDAQSMIGDNPDSTANKVQPVGTQSSSMDTGLRSTGGGMSESYSALLKEINNELDAFSIHHNKLKKMTEDRKPSALILKDRLGVENKANFKKDLKDSSVSKIVDIENSLEYADQQTQVDKDNPYKLGEKIEDNAIKTGDMKSGEALKNVGNSANENGDEIPKRNLSDEEQEEVNMYRKGLGDFVYDNEPGKKFEDRMKADMGDKLYKQRQDKLKFQAKAPMYNKEAQPTEATGVEKVQFDKEKSGWNEREGIKESHVSGKYVDNIGKKRIIDFNLNEVKELTTPSGTARQTGLYEVSLEGMGNTFTNKVNVNEGVVKAMNENKFHTNGKEVFVTKNPVQKLNEGDKKEKSVINEQANKMKHLIGYNTSEFVKQSKI